MRQDSVIRNPESLTVYDWLYFPPTERSPLTMDYILAAEPCPDPSGLRLILRASGRREWIEEAVYRRLIKAQIDANAAPIPNLKLP